MKQFSVAALISAAQAISLQLNDPYAIGTVDLDTVLGEVFRGYSHSFPRTAWMSSLGWALKPADKKFPNYFENDYPMSMAEFRDEVNRNCDMNKLKAEECTARVSAICKNRGLPVPDPPTTDPYNDLFWNIAGTTTDKIPYKDVKDQVIAKMGDNFRPTTGM